LGGFGVEFTLIDGLEPPSSDIFCVCIWWVRQWRRL